MQNVVTLTQNSAFRRVYGRGKSRADAILVTYALPNRLGYCRYGITTSKKIGSAVARNRCRRVIRAAYMQNRAACQGGWDLVFVARGRTNHVKSTQVAQSMQRQLFTLGVIPRTGQHTQKRQGI